MEAAYDTVEKEIKKDMPSRLHARRQMLKVLYPVTEVPTTAAGRKRGTKEVDLVAKLFDEYGAKYASIYFFIIHCFFLSYGNYISYISFHNCSMITD